MPSTPPAKTAPDASNGDKVSSSSAQGLKRGFFTQKTNASGVSHVTVEAGHPAEVKPAPPNPAQKEPVGAAKVNEAEAKPDQPSKSPMRTIAPPAHGTKQVDERTPKPDPLHPPKPHDAASQANKPKQAQPDIYQVGKQNANREAAKEFFQKGLDAMDSGELDRAVCVSFVTDARRSAQVHLLRKASRLASSTDQIASDISLFVNLAEAAQVAAAKKASARVRSTVRCLCQMCGYLSHSSEPPAAEAGCSSSSFEPFADEADWSRSNENDSTLSDDSLPDLLSSDDETSFEQGQGTKPRQAPRPGPLGARDRIYMTLSAMYSIMHATVVLVVSMTTLAVPKVLPYLAGRLARLPTATFCGMP
eukprot:scaffold318146_cov50-Prasinocladus_malaysianus.AAC.1